MLCEALSVRFQQWRDAGVFEALLEGAITEAAKRGEVDLKLVSVDSATVRALHDAAGMRLDPDMLADLEKAAEEAEKARQEVPRWSSSTGCGGRWLVEGAVSEHGEEDVDAVSGECDDGGDVVLALASFPVVMGA